ncbi:putative mannose-1-phosphate guanyltransferase [Corynebacterium diphtheriae HC01]|uniref:Mannose-1-phosphate guanyltransferase n=3 Tax=Corynebacterium diphtheriae TaxID=1717 RepID=Q6NIT4_CORDI|nr:NDP-sugar synthase [Corynebacterium diphtheriae]OWN08179.1 GDP-mannose pyrophosphorylase [Corynebacterium belfantii]AEX41364.1 putative mannose-1-phosphate guanyltransferase [Corynebacterium diphtheriae 31A]AEX43688.1 putative mannose-1-phosphate guanyltransferase [Corynebacterium diphtheriae 241]AEX45903.1 putative mannose-1-phosphate guanyltransferase [Corynebacterium diphtheriae INCA 402]AEX48168.1 putative mannose-1-phosphate guanyltransferase [Corynebacterium diphtheriae BH8]
MTETTLRSDTDAVILVGGKGTRLRPLTVSTPKPMLPTAGVPFLSHLLARIKAAGITHVVLGTSFKAEVFEDYFGDGADLGLEIEYVVEDKPLGTGGGIRNVYDKLRANTVMVFNGDVLGGTDLGGILDAHHAKNADLTMHLVRVPDPRAFGCVPTDAEGRVSAFLEKTEDPPTDQINAGCYVFRRELIGEIPADRVVSVERETFPRLLEEGRRVFGYVDNAYWRDMGTPSDFVRGSSDLVRGIAPSPLLEGKTGECLVDESAGVSDGALLLGGTVIGRGTEIGAGCRLDDTVVFDGVTIEPGAVIEDSIIGHGARIGANARITGCVIGEGAEIGARCELRDGMRVWPGVVIPTAGIRFSSDA